jgi:hypothetical protein
MGLAEPGSATSAARTWNQCSVVMILAALSKDSPGSCAWLVMARAMSVASCVSASTDTGEPDFGQTSAQISGWR